MRYAHLIFVFCLLTSCRETLSEEDKTTIKNEIRNTITNYYNDIRKEGLLAEFKYLDSSADFFWVAPGYSSYIDYDSVAAVIKRNAPLLKSVNNTFDKLIIMPLTGKYAQFSMSTHSVITDTSGKTSRVHFLETGVMIKRKNGWKFLSGQTSVIEQ